MAYIGTSNVDVFPSALRTQVPSGKFINENNFVNILNSIVDYSNDAGYVVSYVNNVLKLIIHGYFFEVRNYTKSASQYAYIMVENTSKCLINMRTHSPIDLDEDGEFRALSIGTAPGEAPEGCSIYSIQITDSSNNIINIAKFSAEKIKWDVNGGNISIVDKVNSKQNNLSAVAPLSVVPNSGELASSISLDTSNFLLKTGEGGVGNVGTTSQPVYFNEGVPFAIQADSGVKAAESSANDFIYAQGALVEGGTLTNNGQKFFMSTYGPNDINTNLGAFGDIWFKYSRGTSADN